MKLSTLTLCLSLLLFCSCRTPQIQVSSTIPSNPQDIQMLDRGEPVPKTYITTLNGNKKYLPTLLQDKKTLIIFYRGSWCPYCNQHLQGLKSIVDELQQKSFQILAISPDRHELVQKQQLQGKIQYQLFSDSSMSAAKGFGIAFKLDQATVTMYKEKYKIDIEADSGYQHHLLPVPAVFLIDQDGIIQFAYSNADYKIRLKPETILKTAQSM